MNKNIIPLWIITSLILINFVLHINAGPGCLDNNKYLAEKFDNKSYNPVACNCPCWKYRTSDNRGECSRCGHAHDLKYDLHTYKSYKNHEKVKISRHKGTTRSLAGLYEQFKDRI